MSGISLDIQSESWNTDDKSWLKSQYGFDTARPCTLDISLFTTDEQINGFVPSGTAVAKITASGLYGPYDPDGADGRETGAGLLLNGVAVDTADGTALTAVGSAFLWQCIVNESKLPALPGADEGVPDADFKTDVPSIRFE